MASLVTDKGLRAFVDAVVADNILRQLGWGTGNGQGNASNDLATPAAEGRVASAMSAVQTNTENDTLQIEGTIVAGAARAITEVGVFDAATNGNMIIYGDFAVITLANGDSITFTVQAVLDQA